MVGAINGLMRKVRGFWGSKPGMAQLLEAMERREMMSIDDPYIENQAPSGATPDRYYYELGVPGTKFDLWNYFTDDTTPVSALVFNVAGNTDPLSVPDATIVDNRYLELTFNTKEEGFAGVGITCTDYEGLSTYLEFGIVLDKSTTSPPSVVGSASINVNQDSGPVTINLDPIFEDFSSADSELTYSISSVDSKALIPSAKIQGHDLVVSFGDNAFGQGSVTVICTDPDGQAVAYTVLVNVTDVPPVVGGLTIVGNAYEMGAAGLGSVQLTATGVQAENDKIGFYLDTDANGKFDQKLDQFLVYSATMTGGVRVATADLDGLAVGTYTIFAVAEEEQKNAHPEYGQAVSNTLQVFAESTVLTGKVLSYVDLHGNTVKATLTGPGELNIFFDNDNAKHNPSKIQITGSDAAKSSFTLVVTPVKGGTILTSDIGDVSIQGGLSSVSAGKVNLLGDFAATGVVKAITLNDVNDLIFGEQHTITLGGTATDKTALTFGRVSDISVTTSATLTSIKAVDWIDGNKVNDVIQAAALGSLTITGVKGGAAVGDFDADISLTNPIIAKTTQTVSSITVAGTTRGNWSLGASKLQSTTVKGDALGSWASNVGFGSLTVSGLSNALMVTTKGDLTSFKGGQTSNVFIDVDGALGTLTTVNYIGGMISAGKAGTISITGQLATAVLPYVAGNFTGDLNITGISSKAGSQSLASLKVAGLAVGNNVDDAPDWLIKGGVGTLTLANAQGVVMEVSALGANLGDVASFKATQVTNFDLHASGKIGSVTVNNWTFGEIHAGSLGTLSVLGTRNDKGVVTGGDYTGGLILFGGGVAKNGMTLQSATIAGSVLGKGEGVGPVWIIDGNVGSITAGTGQEWAIVINKRTSISAAGNLTTFKVGQATNVFLNADGKMSSVTAAGWSGGVINAGSIGSLTVTGNYSGSLSTTGIGLAKNVMALGPVSIGGAVIGNGTVEAPDWSVMGPAGALTFGSVDGLAVHFNDSVGSITIKNAAEDLTLLANGHFDEDTSKSIFGTVASFKAGKVTNGYIQADKLGTFSVNGYGTGKSAVAGDLTNTYVYIVAGGVSGKALALGATTVSGTVNDSTFNLLGNAGVITVGAFTDSAVRVGVSDAVLGQVLPAVSEDFFNPALVLSGFVVTGKPVAATAPSFSHSFVSAPTLTMVSLKIVSGVGDGPFGFAASVKIGTYTRVVSVTPKQTKTVSNQTAPNTYDSVGDYVLKLIGEVPE